MAIKYRVNTLTSARTGRLKKTNKINASTSCLWSVLLFKLWAFWNCIMNVKITISLQKLPNAPHDSLLRLKILVFVKSYFQIHAPIKPWTRKTVIPLVKDIVRVTFWTLFMDAWLPLFLLLFHPTSPQCHAVGLFTITNITWWVIIKSVSSYFEFKNLIT